MEKSFEIVKNKQWELEKIVTYFFIYSSLTWLSSRIIFRNSISVKKLLKLFVNTRIKVRQYVSVVEMEGQFEWNSLGKERFVINAFLNICKE